MRNPGRLIFVLMLCMTRRYLPKVRQAPAPQSARTDASHGGVIHAIGIRALTDSMQRQRDNTRSAFRILDLGSKQFHK
jgi:hypothetical protein